MALGVEARSADQRHHVEAVCLDQRHAAREGGEDRARTQRPERAGDKGAALGVAEPDPVRRHEDDRPRGRACRPPPRAGRSRHARACAPVCTKEGEQPVGTGDGRGPARAHVLADPGEVRKDLGVEEAVEAGEARGRRHESVARRRVDVTGAAVEDRRAGREHVGDEHLQAVAALDPAEEDGEVAALCEGQRRRFPIAEDRDRLTVDGDPVLLAAAVGDDGASQPAPRREGVQQHRLAGIPEIRPDEQQARRRWWRDDPLGRDPEDRRAAAALAEVEELRLVTEDVREPRPRSKRHLPAREGSECPGGHRPGAGQASEPRQHLVGQVIGAEQQEHVAGGDVAVVQQRREVELEVQARVRRHRAHGDPRRQAERGELAREDREIFEGGTGVLGGLTEQHGDPDPVGAAGGGARPPRLAGERRGPPAPAAPPPRGAAGRRRGRR